MVGTVGISGCLGADSETLQLNSSGYEGSVHGDLGFWLSEKVSELSGGEIEIDAYRNNELGGEIQSIQDVATGSLDMYVIAYGIMAVLDVQMATVFEGPYKFNPNNPYEDIFDKADPQDGHPALLEIMDKIIDEGVRPIGTARRCGVRVPENEEPPTNVEMLSQYDFRSAPSDLMSATVEGLGPSAVSIEGEEMNQALATGSVDGLELPYQMITGGKLHENLTHIIETDHIYMPLMVAMSESVFQEFSGEDQQIFYDAVREIQPKVLETLGSGLEDTKQEIQDNDVAILSPDQINYDEFKFSVREKILSDFSDRADVIQQIAYEEYTP